MIKIYFYALISTIIISLISLIGIFTISINKKILQKYIFLLVSLAVGALLGGAFIHLIPESFETIKNGTIISFEIIGGIIFFFVLEKFFHWHHHHDDDHSKDRIHPVGPMILIADGVHNFIDGIVIGASYLIGIEAGIAATIAILLHEIPQEISDFGVLIYAGYSKKRALFVNFISALTAVLGTILVLFAGSFSYSLTTWLPPIAAGSFIYIAMSDLIPEMHKNNSTKESLLQILMLIIGIGIMTFLLILE